MHRALVLVAGINILRDISPKLTSLSIQVIELMMGADSFVYM